MRVIKVSINNAPLADWIEAEVDDLPRKGDAIMIGEDQEVYTVTLVGFRSRPRGAFGPLGLPVVYVVPVESEIDDE